MLAAFKLVFNFLLNISTKNAIDKTANVSRPRDFSEYKIKIIKIH